jgi:chromate transporter
MHRELVDTRRWISERRFLHALNYCMLLPGPEAQQLATYIGWLLHGVRGGLAAGGLFVLPSLAVLIALSWLYMQLGPQAAATWLYGARPAVLAILVLAARRIGSRVLKQGWLRAVAAAAFAALLAGAPFPLVVAAAAGIGWLGRGRIADAAAHASASSAPHAPALIDDDTPPPPHARFTRARLATALAVGVGVGAGAFALLALASDGSPIYAEMARFFTQAPLLTLGGAYAVQPYIVQGAVGSHAWLTAPQMMDGLALGETTPGPLIMVVAFVGFVGAWTHAAADPLAAGVLGACVATFFTFVPSFVFIFAGAPWVERTRDDVRLAGPLTGITAAVVGAILSLAVFFAGHVLFPDGVGGRFDLAAAVLAFAIGVAMYREWLGMVPAIGVAVVAGAAYRVLS